MKIKTDINVSITLIRERKTVVNVARYPNLHLKRFRHRMQKKIIQGCVKELARFDLRFSIQDSFNLIFDQFGTAKQNAQIVIKFSFFFLFKKVSTDRPANGET